MTNSLSTTTTNSNKRGGKAYSPETARRIHATAIAIVLGCARAMVGDREHITLPADLVLDVRFILGMTIAEVLAVERAR